MNKIAQLEPSTISQDEYNILVSSKMYMNVLLSESVATDLINHYLATKRSSQKERHQDDICALWLFGDKDHDNKTYIRVIRYYEAIDYLKHTNYNGKAIIQFRDIYYDLKINDAPIEMIWSEYYDNYGTKVLHE